MELLSIGKFAKKIGLTPETLRRMQEKGELKPCYISSGGTRYYSSQQLDEFLKSSQTDKIVLGYCRVSDPSQRNALKAQVENVKSYMLAKGYRFVIVEHTGSEFDCGKDEIKDFLCKINNKEISKIIVLSKDIIVIPGYNIIEYFCKLNGIELEIIDNTEEEKNKNQQINITRKIMAFTNKLSNRMFHSNYDNFRKQTGKDN